MNKNIFFIGTANKQRSNSAGDHFATKYPEFNFASAGRNLQKCWEEGEVL